MKTLFGIGVALLALALTGSVEAKGTSAHGSRTPASSMRTSSGYGYGHGTRASFGYGYGQRYSPRFDYRNYARDYGRTFRYGTYYSGRNHYQWSKYYYSSSWRCTFYYDPCTCGWFYFYPRTECYYPISYLSVASPLPIGQPDLPVLPPAPPTEAPGLPTPPPGPAFNGPR
jgi:hypothetical protein